jgi:uncharacterized protein (DUF362 family)
MIDRSAQKRFRVGVVRIREPAYPKDAPYNPSAKYPEYPFYDHLSDEPNLVYEGVRHLFSELKLDAAHWGTPKWNPLGCIISPGMTVLIKPNFVLSNVVVPYIVSNITISSDDIRRKDIFSIVTHPSVVRTIVDYCWIALKGDGRIIIADAPQYNCDFRELLDITKLEVVAEFVNRFHGPSVKILDLRKYWSKTRHFVSLQRELTGDPQGSVTVNLGKESALYNSPKTSKFYGAVYDRDETIYHHSGERQEYQISRTILTSDVVISVPKLKTHKKVGVTCNLKNLVGICTDKNHLVHYTLGSPRDGGDQYPDNFLTMTERTVIKFERWMYDHFLAKRTRWHEFVHRFIYGFLYLKIFAHIGLKIQYEKRLLDAGNWYGNDTAWRMVVDLAKIIYFSDKEGRLHTNMQRKLFSVVDGIMGGENMGPLSPDPKPAGILIGGDNLLAVDLVATRLMGFDPLKLKQFTMLDPKFDFGPRRAEEIDLRSNDEEIQYGFKDKTNRLFSFKPHPGWVGHIEI